LGLLEFSSGRGNLSESVDRQLPLSSAVVGTLQRVDYRDVA
jgi:hypothetical protein